MRRIGFLQPQADLTPTIVRDMVGLVGYDIPVARIEGWTELEQLMVYDWAAREHLRAGESLSVVRRRPRPSLVSGRAWSEVDP